MGISTKLVQEREDWYECVCGVSYALEEGELHSAEEAVAALFTSGEDMNQEQLDLLNNGVIKRRQLWSMLTVEEYDRLRLLHSNAHFEIA